MVDRFKAFQDDEEYVYLDEAGMAHQKLEFTVAWNSAPDKNLLVTLSKNDTLSYLESKIGETMEKFDLFEGLTDLRASNLTNGKTPLPKKGGVGSAVKTGDHLFCDLVSKDQWLDVAMQLHDVRLCLLFEVKVINSARVSELLTTLVSIANLFLESNEIPIRYEVSELRVEKRCTDKEVKLTRGGQGETTGAPLGDFLAMPLVFYEDTKVENCFNFLDRKIACYLVRKEEDVPEAERSYEAAMQSPFLSICDSEGAEPDISKLRAFPIRYFRKEPLQLQNSTFELQGEEAKKSQGLGKSVCCCCLW